MKISLFASVIPIIAVGLGSYLFSSSAIQEQANKSNIRNLSTASHTIDSSLERVQRNALQLLFGSFYSTNLQEQRQKDYAGFYSTIARDLSLFQAANTEIYDVLLYTGSDDYLLSPVSGGRRIEPEDRKIIDKELAANPNFIWTTQHYPFMAQSGEHQVTLILKVPIQAARPTGLLFISLNSHLFQNLMGSFLGYDGENMMILDADGQVVAQYGTLSGVEPPPHDLFKRIHSKAGSDSFNVSWELTNYLVTPITSNFNQWTYIDMIPIKELNKQSKGIAIMTLIIVAAFLLIGLALAFWGTKRAYRPIEKLVDLVKGNQSDRSELDEMGIVMKRWTELSQTASHLQTQVNEQKPLIREMVALQALQGHFLHYTPEQLNRQFIRYHLPSVSEHAVMIIAYDQPSGREGRFFSNEKDLILFAVKNIIQYFLQNDLHGIPIHLPDDQIAVWLWKEGETEEMDDWLQRVKSSAEHLRLRLSEYLRLPVTIGISSGFDKQREMLPRLYQEAMLALRSRFINGNDRIIYYTPPTAEPDIHYRYPIEIEAHYENSLRLGDLEEAVRMLNEFARATRGVIHKSELVDMNYYHLLTATLRTAFLLGIPSEALFTPNEEDPYIHIRNFTTIHELNDWFRDRLVEPIVMNVKGKQMEEHEAMIQTVVHFIEENYHLDLSLDQCAQLCGLSSHYLSKLFKRSMDLTFIEYLTRLRIEHSKRYLEETELTINEIAGKVGYQPKNFIRVFKKHMTVTPKQYRDSTLGF
ncbi:helix-turn-helix domain-containing protein [Paenibacillus dendrobii]|nr:helix-turn-helix domain-containing protein [Paenibacillus dendrobii]